MVLQRVYYKKIFMLGRMTWKYFCAISNSNIFNINEKITPRSHQITENLHTTNPNDWISFLWSRRYYQSSHSLWWRLGSITQSPTPGLQCSVLQLLSQKGLPPIQESYLKRARAPSWEQLGVSWAPFSLPPPQKKLITSIMLHLYLSLLI